MIEAAQTSYSSPLSARALPSCRRAVAALKAPDASGKIESWRILDDGMCEPASTRAEIGSTIARVPNQKQSRVTTTQNISTGSSLQRSPAPDTKRLRIEELGNPEAEIETTQTAEKVAEENQREEQART